MDWTASLITLGAILAIFGMAILYNLGSGEADDMKGRAFVITGNGAIFFGIFMLMVGLGVIIYGILSTRGVN